MSTTEFVVSCEHAAWHLPDSVDLGVPLDVLRSQASWDPGARELAERLALALPAPLFLGNYSRMFVDLNRAADHPDVIPTHSYGADVPGNLALSTAMRTTRLAHFHTPYWQAVGRAVDATLQQGRCVHLSVHSFCPSLDPTQRTFELGVLFDPTAPWEAALAQQLLRELTDRGIDARANQPYRGDGPALVTAFRNARDRQRYAGIELEVSHSVNSRVHGIARVASALVHALAATCGPQCATA